MSAAAPTLRTRLQLILAVGFAVLILAAGFWIERTVDREVTAEFDAALLARARTLVALTEQEDGHIQFDYDPKLMPEFERERNPDLFQFWLADGTPLYRSARLAEGGLRLAGGENARDVVVPDGRTVRALLLRYDPHIEPVVHQGEDERTATQVGSEPIGLVLAVARGRTPLDALIAEIRWSVIGASGLCALLAILLAWRTLYAGLHPLERVAAQVERLNVDTLGVARIELPRGPREMSAVVRQINALLDRLSESFKRERRFNANVAHELRTPIAELRTLSEVSVRWPGDPEVTAEFFTDVALIASRMERVVADLLLLARCQAGVEFAELVPVHLSAQVEAAWARHEATADRVGLRMHIELSDASTVKSDPGKLDIILDNLFGNAVSYARPGSEIRCIGGRDDDGYHVTIENRTENLLDEGDVARLVEPFWRKDHARRSDEHAGLGLSVVAALALLLRIDLAFDHQSDGVFRVRLAGWES